jgi:hypothetical protein
MRPSLSSYIDRKLDGVKGEIPQLVHMLKKSFSTPNFRSFWTVWNPIYSYVLTYYVYKPVRKVLPRPLSVLVTFVVNGLFHDFMVYLVLGHTTFKIAQLFLIYGLLVIVEPLIKKMNIKNKMMRVVYNLSLLILPILVVL